MKRFEMKNAHITSKTLQQITFYNNMQIKQVIGFGTFSARSLLYQFPLASAENN